MALPLAELDQGLCCAACAAPKGLSGFARRGSGFGAVGEPTGRPGSSWLPGLAVLAVTAGIFVATLRMNSNRKR